MLRLSLTLRCVLVVAFFSIAPSALLAQSTSPLYWDATTGTGFLWSDTTNWWTTDSGATNPAAAPINPTNDAVFDGTGVNGVTIVQLSGAQSARGLYFNNTGTTLLDSSSSTSETLTIGTDGITVASGTGAVTLGDATNKMPISISVSGGGSETWTNNSTANTLTVVNGVSSTATSSSLIIVGAGNTTFTGIITNGGGPLGITQNGTGTLTFTGANTSTGSLTINSGTVTVSGAGGWATSATALTGFSVGGTTATGNAVLNINTSGSFIETAANSTVGGGTSGVGVINQSSGTFTPGSSTGFMSLGLNATGAPYGAYNLSGGTLTTGGTSGIIVGGGGLGVFTQSAGTFTDNRHFGICSTNPGGTGIATFTGGTLSVASGFRFLLNNDTTGVANAVLNVGTEAGGNAVLSALTTTAPSVQITGATNASLGNSGTLNLNSGTLKILVPIAKGGTTSATATVNFNGGTLQAGQVGVNLINSNIPSVNLYKGGVTIDTLTNTGVSLTANLLAAAGNGVYPAGGTLAIAADGSGGTGYVGAPIVAVSGGSGTAASAIATISGGTITGVTLTNPGQNYQVGDNLIFTFSGGGASSAATPFVYTLQPADLAANNTGGLTKIGSGTLTLSGAASTFSGGLTINNGSVLNGALSSTAAFGSGNVIFGAANSPTLNLSGNNASIGLLSGGSNGVVTSVVTGTSAPTLTLNGTGSQTFAGIIQNSSTTSTIGVTLSAGTQTLSGPNTYTGATNINGSSTLRLGTGGSLGNTAISVGNGANFNPAAGTFAGTTVAGAAGATLALGNGAIFNSSDNSIGTFTLNQNASFAATPALNLGGATLSMDIGPSGTDTLAVVQGSGGGTASVFGPNTINLTTVGSSLINGTFNLITAASGLASGGTFQFPNSTTTEQVTLGSTTYTLNLVNSDSAEQVVVTGGVSIPATTYWNGSLSGGNTGVWTAGGAGAATNWTSDAAGATDTLQVPGITTNVVFTTNSAGNFANTTLGADVSINSLTFSGTGSATGSVGIGGNNTLTINATSANGNTAGNGITVQSGSGAHTISCNIALGGSQTWTNNSTSTLTVSGNIGDGGSNYSLAIAGTGSFLFSGNNSYGGATTVPSGATLTLSGTNTTSGTISVAGNLNIASAAALGTSPLTINAGAVIDNTSTSAITLANNNSMNWSGDFTFNGSKDLNLGTGNVTLAASRQVTVNAGNLTVGGIISGSGFSLTTAGNGTLILTGANTYTGTTTIGSGTLSAAHILVASGASNLGNATTPVVLGTASTAGTLNYTGGADIFTRGLTVSAGGGSLINSGSGLLTVANGVITAGGTLTLAAAGASGLTVNSTISSSGGVTVNSTGSGVVSLNGANSYTGATNVNGGVVRIGPGASLGNTAISVASGATFTPQPGGGSITAAGTLTMPAGAAFNMNDGAIGAFRLTNAGTALTVGDVSGAAPTLGFDISNLTTDKVVVTGAASVLATGAQINITPIGSSLSNGTYSLITAASGLDGGGGFYFLGNAQSMPLVIGPTTYTLTLQNSATAEQLVVTGGAPVPAATYWTGALSSSWSTGGGGAASNWTSDAGGTTDTLILPGNTTNVIFTANSAANFANTTLDSDFTINSVTFAGSGTSAAGSVMISGNTLTINAGAAGGNTAGGGITVQPGSGAHTIASNITLGASQTWTNNSTSPLTISGTIGDAGNALGLTTGGAGTIVLTGTSTYTGVTTVNAGTLRIGNGGTTGSISSSSKITVGANGTALFYRSDANYVLPWSKLDGVGTVIYQGINSATNFNPNNSFSTVTAVPSSFTGTIVVQNARINPAAGATNFGGTSAIIVQPGAQLAVVVDNSTYNIPLTISGQGWAESDVLGTPGIAGALRLDAGAIWAGPITLAADARIDATSRPGGGGTITGTISGNHELEIGGGIIAGGGTLTLFPATENSFAAVRISALDTARAANALAFPTTTPAVLTMNGGTLQLEGYSFTFANLSGTSGVIQNGATGGTPAVITVGTDGTSTSYSGTLVNGSVGLLGISKVGGGMLTLSGVNTYSGGSTITGGTLRVANPSGSATGTGTVAVGDGANPATLAGSTTVGQGTISGAVTVNSAATISGGSGATLTLTGGLTLKDGSLSSFNLTQAGANNAAALVAVTGGFTGPATTSHTINFSGAAALGTYDLFSYDTGSPTLSQFTLGTQPTGNFSYALAIANNEVDLLVTTPAGSAAWNFQGDGAFSDTTKWSPTQVPSGVGTTATFAGGSVTTPIDNTTVVSGAIAVAVDGADTAGSLVFDNPTVSYTLTNDSVGGHGLTLNNAGAVNGSFTGAVVTVNHGSHTIAANLTLADSAGTTFNLAGGTALSVSGAIAGSGANQSLTLTGGGTLTLSNANSYSGGNTVNAGTLRTTANGALGAGPLAVNSAAAATPLVDVNSNESVSALTGGVSGTGSATIRVESGQSLGVAPASGTSTFAGTLNLVAGTATPGTGGTLGKSGIGTEVLAGAVQLNNGTVLNVSSGTLRVSASGGTIGTRVTANVSGTGTLELAGAYSALGTTTPANRTAIRNDSMATAGLLVSSGNQEVGGIDGAGNVQVSPPTGLTDSLTADHITAGSLVIGGDATSSAVVTITASNPDGTPLAQSSGFAVAGSLASSAQLAGGALNSSTLPAADDSSVNSLSVGGSTFANLNLGGSVAAVPEPSAIVLLILGSSACLLPAVRRRMRN